MLEERFPDGGETGPEVLAQHLTRCGPRGAGDPVLAPGRRAGGGRSANVEAIAHLSQGLELVATLPGASDHLGEELALRLALAGPLMATKGYRAPEVERTYSRAWACANQLGRSAGLFPVLRGLWHCRLGAGRAPPGPRSRARLVALVEEQGTPSPGPWPVALWARRLFFRGRFADPMVALDEGIAIDDAVAAWMILADLSGATRSAPASCAGCYRAGPFGSLDFRTAPWSGSRPGLTLGRRLAHANSVAFALGFAAVLHNLRREFAAARRRAEATDRSPRTSTACRSGTRRATMCRGFAMVGLGQQMEGAAQLRAGLGAWNELGGHLLDTQWLGFLYRSPPSGR